MKHKTTEQWTGRQCSLKLGNNKWTVGVLATTPGSLSDLGGAVAEFTTTRSEQATEAMLEWITSGLVPSGFETHCPSWFTPRGAR